ncbi:USP [Symbiodinium necroappetens]|uniref:UTP-monosaccharide-1-phosphate uridylyltransferase n=1 Tax=Symbiodinium necroappetens TaxID=1628268 RepID=A0A812MR86_9DINO|nr:USP [Symbiodinium necroappetens]
MLNVHIVSQRLLVGKDLEQVRAAGWLPGLEGPAFLRLHSRWQGTSEDAKKTHRVLEHDAVPALRIWQFDDHTALAGEAKTMLTRFGHAMKVRVRFLGNSFPGNVCRNYDLCAQPEDKELLQGLLRRYYKDKQAFATVAAAFEEALGQRLSREADVLMCSQPLGWCRFLINLRMPMLLYAGLPVMWDVPEADRTGWAADFADILMSQEHVVIANSVFVAREVQWQFGVRVPTLRPLGLHTNAMHVPVLNASVLVSRFGTSGGLSECLLEKFAAVNRHWFPLHFVQMESLLFAEHLAHLFADDVPESQKKALLKQLNAIDGSLPGGGLKGYLDRGRSLLQEAQAGVNPFAGLVPSVPEGQQLFGETGPGSPTFAAAEELGMAELSKCCFCLVAGGLGERLGFPGIKIGIVTEVITGTTFIELFCSYILACQSYARTDTGDSGLLLPLAIMTSGDTHDKTVHMMRENAFFGMVEEQVHFLKQEKVPALVDVDAHISAKDGCIETKPHGHGDIHGLMHQRGLANRWVEEGRRWFFVFQDTNPLHFRILCALLGVSAKNGYVMNSVAIPRIPGESIGGICRLTSPSGTAMTLNVEYNQLEPLLKETSAGGDIPDDSGYSPYPGNINVLLFHLPRYSECLDGSGGIVPEFINPKWADPAKTRFKSSSRLECMMQDFPRLCGPGDKVGVTQVERWISKTSVKNNLADAVKKNPPECALTCEADLYSCNVRLLQLAGADIEEPDEVSFLGIHAKIGAKIVLKPSFAISVVQLQKKLKGRIAISKRSTLVLEGDVVVDGLELDGALHLAGTGCARGLQVQNRGVSIVGIPDSELADASPSHQIRGYKADILEMTSRHLEGDAG